MRKGLCRTLLPLCALALFLPAVQAQNVFVAILEGAQEIPSVTVPGASGPINNPGLATGAHGSARIRITQSGIEYEFQASNFGTAVTQAHIHLGPRGANGPVVAFLFNAASDGPFTGSMSGLITEADVLAQPNLGLNTLEDLIQNIRRGNTYVNVHTMQFPPGEIRGQLEHPNLLRLR